jgi:hypothetical protein
VGALHRALQLRQSDIVETENRLSVPGGPLPAASGPQRYRSLVVWLLSVITWHAHQLLKWLDVHMSQSSNAKPVDTGGPRQFLPPLGSCAAAVGMALSRPACWFNSPQSMLYSNWGGGDLVAPLVNRWQHQGSAYVYAHLKPRRFRSADRCSAPSAWGFRSNLVLSTLEELPEGGSVA